MDQRAKGGPSLPPPSTLPLLPPAPPQQYPEKEVGSGKRKRREKEGGGGAVLEVLIEGCCGAAGQRQLPFPGRERTCTEGNVRLRIGVQTAKRTKKPPKTLEGYECKPTIRTYQRPGRGETGRGGQEGGGSGQENSPQEEGDGEQNQGSDPNTTQTRKMHSSSPSSSSSSSSSSTAPTSTTPSPANPQTAPAKQVPVKLAHKLDTPPEKPRHPDPPDAHIKLPSPAQMDQATSSDPTASSPHYPPPSSPHSPLVKDPSGEAGVKGEGGMLNRGVPTVIYRPTRLTKVKARKHNCSSSATPTNVNSTTRPPASSPHQTDLASQDRTTGFSCLPTPPPSTPLLPDQRGAPVADGRLSPNASLTRLSRGPLVQSSVGNERGREEKAKKKNEKDDKARGEKGKGKRGGKEDRGRNESPKMDRDENARDEREREGTGMDERGRYMTGKKERKGEEDKESEKPGDLRMNKWPSSTRCQMLSEVPSRKPSTPSPDPDLTSETGESDYPGGPSRPTVSPSNPSTASPSSPLTSLLPPSLSRHSSSPPTSPREQDSRPLKKRKTRRPSWTRLVNRAQRLAENPDGSQDAPLVALLTTTTPQTPPTTPQTPPSTPQTLPTINSPYLRSAESCLAPSVPPPPSPSSLFPSTATAVRPRQAGRPASPTQTHLLTSDPSPSPGPDRPVSQTRKRGRPKSQTSSWNEPPPRHSPKPTRAEVLPHGHDETSDPHVLNPVLDHSPTLTNPSSPNPMPRKRGRPKRLPPSPLLPKHTLQDPNRGTLTPSGGEEGGKDFPSEKGNRQLRMRSIIGEMKMRKRRRLLREMLSGCGVGEEGRGGEGGRDNSRGGSGGVCGSPTAPSLSSSFGGNLVPQINVSKRGTIYMGKRRGRKPKAPANSNPASQSTLFTSLSGPSLFSSPQSQPHPPLSHPFPSPSLTHSSGAQSPYSDGGFTEPAPSLFLPHTFSLPSPSSSCASPRPLSSSSFSSSSSLSPSLKRSSPGQGRHPLFHHPSSRLSSPPFTHPPHPLHPNLSVSPTHLKEATPSPISASHSKEVLPSDSVIGLDHNSISERGERRGQGRGGVTMGITSEFTRSVFRTGLGVSLKGQRQLSPSMLLEHPSSVPSLFRVSASPPSASPRHTLPPSDSVEPRDRHRYRRRGYECPYTCPPWPCLGHNQRSHLELCPCLAHNTLKRQKHKRKRKYQHLLMHVHDPDFLSELDDLIGQFSKVRIGRHRDWARAGLGQDLDESVGKRRHSSSLSSHNFHSNVYRINLSGYYSPHPLSYPPHPSLTPLHPCHGLPYGSRNPERMLRCGCPTKPCESLDQGEYDQGRRCPLQGNTGHLHPSSLSSPLSSSTTSSSTSMPLSFGYYRGFPLTMAHYPNPHLHPSFPLPPPHPYAPHLHPPHLLLNPARFHKRRSRQLREAGLGGGGGEDVRGRGDGERARVRSCPAGSIPGLSCVCGGSEHKLRHKHRHRQPNHDGKEEEEERVAGSQPRSEFTTGEGGSRKTGGQGSAGLRESPWQHRHGKYPSAFSSASPKPASSSSSSSERLKHTPLTCLGSSHLSSFGECWGGRQNPWLRRGGHGAGFRPPDPTWVTLTEGQRTATVGWSEREAGESHTPCHSTFAPSSHTNLFTSSATSGRGMRSGRDNWRPGSQDGSLRSEEPSQTERRGTGPHYDLSRRQLKWLRTGQRFGAKRGPGRPRKNPLASPLVSPTTPPNPPTEKHVQNRDRNRGSRGGDTVQEVIEAVIRRQRRRRRKRRRIEEEEKEEGERLPCLQSSGEGEPVTHTPSICTGQSELSQTPSLTPASQSDKGADRLRKRFQRAGLYSDDYKTTDPSSQSQLNRERLEYTPGEQDYSLLPAPIHVGKYLRMRRIDFQLPFDVLWLFRHNQLHKELDVPLSREISSCQPNEKSLSSHQTGVSLPPSPQEECSSPSKKLFLHLDMEPMTTSDRVFVLKHHVFLLRNWEWVRDRQIRLRREREGERDKEGGKDGGGVSSDVATGDNNNNIMSGRPVVVKKKVVLTSDPQCPPNPLSTTTHLTQPQSTREEKKQGEEEGRRKVRKERLNNILLKLQQA